MIDVIYAATVSLAILLVALLATGIHKASGKVEVEGGPIKGLAIKVGVALCLWLATSALLARSGVLSVWSSRPPRVLMLPLTMLAALILINRARLFPKILLVVPAHWPVALQSFRVGVELVLWGLFVNGAAPVQVTFEGRNFDVLIGLTAPLIALGIVTRRIRPIGVLAWNVFGLGMLANIVGTAATSVPGPLHLNWPGEPFTALATWPVVWIPAFLAPLAVFLHVVSIRQTLLARRSI